MDLLIIYLLMLIIPAIASYNIKKNYSIYKGIRNNRGITGFEVARKILDANELNNVYIVENPNGELSDCYDSSRKTVKLSPDVFNGETVAALAIAAHECGHAIQDKEGYSFLKIRHTLIPLVKFSSIAGYIAIMISILAGILNLLWIGIALECVILFFQLITLPVEFNASNRALKQIEKLGIVEKDEKEGCKKMLTSAALTYVASVLSAVMQIVRLVLMGNSRRR